MKKVKSIFNYFWKDNVWSKVIASIIFAILVAIFFMIRDNFKGNSIGAIFTPIIDKIINVYERFYQFLLKPFIFYNWSIILLIIVIILADRNILSKYFKKIILSAIRGPFAHGIFEKEFNLSNSDLNKSVIGIQQIYMCEHTFKVKPTFTATLFHIIIYFNYTRDNLEKNLPHLFRIEIIKEKENEVTIKKIDGKSCEIIDNKVIFENYQNEEFEIYLGYIDKAITLGMKITCEKQTVYVTDIARCKYYNFTFPNKNIKNLVNIKWIEEYWS